MNNNYYKFLLSFYLLVLFHAYILISSFLKCTYTYIQFILFLFWFSAFKAENVSYDCAFLRIWRCIIFVFVMILCSRRKYFCNNFSEKLVIASVPRSICFDLLLLSRISSPYFDNRNCGVECQSSIESCDG